ncbi:MAG: hypothetical protein QOJ56_2863 [Mycobacterium sp.]|jgi:hypothetical protein|nr:hypothetical protein [Mycobacterium sp.]MDT5318463.1 hypothetical protein [Mycobacterium sp.]MDT5354331.1 hypothetical protein [Mycobacterium sp.]
MMDDTPEHHDPAWERTRVGHVATTAGEVITVHVGDDQQIVIALYAAMETMDTVDDDTPVQPGLVISCTPDEAELLGSVITLAAVTGYTQRRPKVRVVTGDGET